MSAEDSRATAITKAKHRGDSVVFANDFMLQLDLDCKNSFDFAIRSIQLASDTGHICPSSVLRTNGLTGRGWHVYVLLNSPVPLITRISLHGMMLSDPTREILNLRLAVSMPKDVIPGKLCFYEPFLFEAAHAAYESIPLPKPVAKEVTA